MAWQDLLEFDGGLVGEDVEAGRDSVTEKLGATVRSTAVLAFSVGVQVGLIGLEFFEEADGFRGESYGDDGAIFWHCRGSFFEVKGLGWLADRARLGNCNTKRVGSQSRRRDLFWDGRCGRASAAE